MKRLNSSRIDTLSNSWKNVCTLMSFSKTWCAWALMTLRRIGSTCCGVHSKCCSFRPSVRTSSCGASVYRAPISTTFCQKPSTNLKTWTQPLGCKLLANRSWLQGSSTLNFYNSIMSLCTQCFIDRARKTCVLSVRFNRAIFCEKLSKKW